MTKKELIEHIAEKARISTQRGELAYDAFWESILSELKTGHFSLPFGTGTINIKSKGDSPIKVKEVKGNKPKETPQKAVKKQPVAKKKVVAKAKPVAAKKKTVAKKTAKSKKKK